jgi:hypothetical protein
MNCSYYKRIKIPDEHNRVLTIIYKLLSIVIISFTVWRVQSLLLKIFFSAIKIIIQCTKLWIRKFKQVLVLIWSLFFAEYSIYSTSTLSSFEDNFIKLFSDLFSLNLITVWIHQKFFEFLREKNASKSLKLKGFTRYQIEAQICRFFEILAINKIL